MAGTVSAKSNFLSRKNSLCDFKDVLIKVKRLSNWLSIHSNADSYVIAPDREICSSCITAICQKRLAIERSPRLAP